MAHTFAQDAITPAATLNMIVATYPQTLPVMQRFGLDTCCGGSVELRVAAAHHDLDLAELLAALRAVIAEEAQ